MAGLWLKNGLHLNIQNKAAKEFAAKMRKGISIIFLGSQITAVHQDLPLTSPTKLKNSMGLSLPPQKSNGDRNEADE